MPLAAKAEITEASQIIQKLLAQGVSKYRIAKELGVNWRTVHNWSQRFFEPKPEMLLKLKEIRGGK